MKETEVAWLAGLLEGEGWFGLHRQPSVANCRYANPRIGITSTDRDVLEHVRDLVGGGQVTGPLPVRKETHTPTHQYAVTGRVATEVMEAVLPLMHSRRANRIRDVLNEAREVKQRREAEKLSRAWEESQG